MSADQHAEVLADRGKLVIVEVEGRRFPGVWMAGDTLRSIVWMLHEARSEASASVALEEVAEVLDGYLRGYVRFMQEEGRQLPFVPPDQG